LQHLLDQDDRLNTLVFQVDLFSAAGPLPRSMPDVASRQKDIQYSSRTRLTTDVYKRLLGWKKRTYDLLVRIPEADLTDEDRKLRDDLATLPEITILQLIYQQKLYEGDAKDYEFSHTSMLDHWSSGLEDTRRTLDHKRFLEIPAPGTGIVTHDVHRVTD
jgi:NTE family protein